MKVVQKINNNVAVCMDGNGRELIAFGKGIGFPKTPYEVTDLSAIQRTYYGIASQYLSCLHAIPEQYFDLSASIVDIAKTKLENEINSNIVFTLADHLYFAVQRHEKQMKIKVPFTYDVLHLYETEVEIGNDAVKLIEQRLHIKLPSEEAVSIALHFINAENTALKQDESVDHDRIIQTITSMIEKHFSLTIDELGFNYSRFVTHMQYLLKRKIEEDRNTSENQKLFMSMKDVFPKTYYCVLDIQQYMKTTFHWLINEEELLYLMLHINRMCMREDCNHQGITSI